jgi:7,8-dihydroneopterin aldolase/epimerase/oxygenase
MDRISLGGLRAYGRHGADAGERARRQPFDIAVTAEIDLHAAAASDDLTATLNYASLRDRIVRIVATTSYALLERLAADLIEAVFEDRRVRRAEVTLSKPGILDGATPSVTIDRANPNYVP